MIIPMNMDYAKQISSWTYENEYSIYSFNKNDDTLRELLNGNYFACLNKDDELVGYFCFGKSAQIPTVESSLYSVDILDMGLGLKPSLCGKGCGFSFVNEGMKYAQRKFNYKRIRLTVAEFNTRAIKTYKKAGFKYSAIVTHKKTHNKFWIMIYKF